MINCAFHCFLSFPSIIANKLSGQPAIEETEEDLEVDECED